MSMDSRNKKQRGFSLVEVLVVVLIIGIVGLTFYKTSALGTRLIIEGKNRLAAVALVNERMEIVRNLPYEKVGIQGSMDVPGNLPAFEEITANGRKYGVAISARYFDDEMDGTVSSSPADLIPNDYKIVKVEVTWKDATGIEKKVSSTSRFVPPGLETSVGGSPLSINVDSIDDVGITTPVAQTSVHISNNTVTPAISDTISTDDEGHIMLPAARVSTGNKLTITKNGYETIETMDSTPTFLPVYKHVDVVPNNLNQYIFYQNKLSNLHIQTVDLLNNPVGNIAFSIEGGKIIGHDDLNNVVFNMANAISSTDSSGEKIYAGISPGNYNILVNSNEGYEFVDFDPSISPAVVPAGTDYIYKIRMAKINLASFVLTIKDELDGAPIADAEVTLLDNSDNEIFSKKKSSVRGIVYYPDAGKSLLSGSYKLKIEANGYIAQNETLDIAESLVKKEILLKRN